MVTQEYTAGKTADDGKDRYHEGRNSPQVEAFEVSNLYSCLMEDEDVAALAVAAPLVVRRVASHVHNYLQRKRQEWRRWLGSSDPRVLQEEVIQEPPEAGSRKWQTIPPARSDDRIALKGHLPTTDEHDSLTYQNSLARCVVSDDAAVSLLLAEGPALTRVPVMLHGNHLPIDTCALVEEGEVALSAVRFRGLRNWESTGEYWAKALSHALEGAPALGFWDKLEDWTEDRSGAWLRRSIAQGAASLSAHFRRHVALTTYSVSEVVDCSRGCCCGSCT